MGAFRSLCPSLCDSAGALREVGISEPNFVDGSKGTVPRT